MESENTHSAWWWWGYKRGGVQRALDGWVGGNHYHALLDLRVATFTVCHANMHMCRSSLNVWARSGAASGGLVNRLCSAAIAQAVAQAAAPMKTYRSRLSSIGLMV